MKLNSFLTKAVSPNSLGLFRLIFGAFMIFEVLYYFNIQLIEIGFINPKILFPYDFFEFLKPLPQPIMQLILGLMLVAAILITIGWKHRIAGTFFFFANTYLLFLDKGIYNNHIYLFSLIALLLAFTNADRAFSIKSRNRSKGLPQLTIPNWQVWLIRFQIVVVYFYGGIAKLNPDWLFRQEPMRSMVKALTGSESEVFVMLLNYGGLFFDLLVGFALLFKKTRWIAIIALLFFHITNAIIFDDIGIFPYIMIFATVVFFEGETIEKLFNRKKEVALTKKELKKKQKAKSAVNVAPKDNFNLNKKTQKWVAYFLAVYILFQLIFPFRHLVLPNKVDWTSIAQNFSWRMKMTSRKAETFKFVIADWEAPARYDVKPNTYMNTMQLQKMIYDPRMSAQFARFIAEEAKKQKNIANPDIRVDIQVIYNGRGPYQLFDQDQNLAEVEYSPFKKNFWILEDD